MHTIHRSALDTAKCCVFRNYLVDPLDLKGAMLGIAYLALRGPIPSVEKIACMMDSRFQFVPSGIKPQATLLIDGSVGGLHRSEYLEVFLRGPTLRLCLHRNVGLFP